MLTRWPHQPGDWYVWYTSGSIHYLHDFSCQHSFINLLTSVCNLKKTQIFFLTFVLNVISQVEEDLLDPLDLWEDLLTVLPLVLQVIKDYLVQMASEVLKLKIPIFIKYKHPEATRSNRVTVCGTMQRSVYGIKKPINASVNTKRMNTV